ncbi:MULTISPECIES: DUF2922 domain-containing protein [unclassified Gemella]|uniref:DUF2922 domain-containing protein n=1 Tax=unclassified Gemella TaxID=2624949 RepID=UPI00107466C0|nr:MULTISPECIES: DUF2922 domain-containing protein [unclassified Gemella]MBF0710368.1 DUF2922 domain-containing protein [Gemella sp. GL1.1]MBF0747182.1 DUF2922 domain-containing protein [Gemella sp. 19428wG2_WT2a]NYS27712.1 DUF2922 domain-containing protein [Gemella sp. GL1]TFU58185.1 DUF2922 domain-containing protein [Gemella sp. WT2a]
MKKTLVLVFKTEDKKTYRLNLVDPKENLSKLQVQTLAEKIIEEKVFDNSKRELKSFEKAIYVSRKEEALA